jgi:O-antigen biosynthesis protein
MDYPAKDWRGKTAIVSAVTGGYDYPQNSIIIDGVDYLMFTDGTASFVPGWQYCELQNPLGLDSRRLAKGPKLNPHAFPALRSYEYLIWVDGSMTITNHNFVEEILAFMDKGFVVSPHFDPRHCAYGEGEFCMSIPKYEDEPLRQQLDFYKEEGFPVDYGLYECGISARRMGTPGLSDLGSLWYEQNMTWSYQDQVSFSYALWKTGFEPDVLPETFRNFDWVIVNAHQGGEDV